MATSDALGNAARINTKVDLNAATQTFTVNAGAGAIDLTLAGPISNGSVTKLGGGVLQYTASNTYAGLTTVSAGTLLLNDNGSNAAIGTGGLLINGTGTVRLAQGSEIDNTATVTVDAGTFDLNGNFEAIATLAGAGGQVTSGAGGTLQILAGSTTYAGNITGAGAFQVLGGTQTLSGVNTYTGPTTVTGATLKAASNTALSPNSNFSLGAGGVLDLNGKANTIGALNSGAVATGLVTNTAAAAASLTVGNTNTNGNFGGVIVNGAGTVSLVKVGSATQILTGINTYTGNTTIGGGALQVDGRIASANTFVNALGTLSGVGVIGGNVVNSGTVSPGHSVATLTVNGSYTQTPAGALRVEFAGLDAGQHDVLAVGGAAALDGTVRLVNLGSVRLKRGQSVTFLTAGGGVSGKFSTVNSDSFLPSGRLLRAGVVYHASTVDLAAIQGSFANDLGSLTPNQKAVAHNLDNVVNDSRANKIIDYLDQESLGSLRGDLDKIAPEELAAIFNIGVSLANVQTANLERRMGDLHDGSTGFSSSGYGVGGNSQSYGGTTQTYSGDASYNSGHTSYRGPTGDGGKEMRAPIDNRVGVFVTGVGEFTNIGNTANARGYDLTTGGLTIGVDYKVTEHFVIGLNTGYARSSAELNGNGRVTVDGAKLGLYATYFTGTGFYVDAAANGGYNSYDTRRSALKGTASGGTNGLEFNGLLATGFDWKTPDGLTIGPVASVQYTNVQMNSFKEHGSLAPLKFNDQSGESLRTALGVKMSYDFHPVASGVVIRPEVRASWQHEFADSSYALTSRFANGAGNTFTVHGPQIGDDSLLVGAGVAVLWNERTSTYVYYDGEVFRSNYNSNNVSGGVRLTF